MIHLSIFIMVDYRDIRCVDGSDAIVFSNGWSAFSNIHYATFTIGGIKYNSSEQAFQALKACHLKDYVAFSYIMTTKYPSKLGLARTQRNSCCWDSISADQMLLVLVAKFQQNPEMTKVLLETGVKKIIYASSFDCIWGTGLKIDEDGNGDEDMWTGVNWLGSTLERTRALLVQDEDIKCIPLERKRTRRENE